jgi:hypothetical protein
MIFSKISVIDSRGCVFHFAIWWFDEVLQPYFDVEEMFLGQNLISGKQVYA